MPSTSFPLLETIDDPAQLRQLARAQLKVLAAELRGFVLESVSRTGGHLSSNLGTVELTVALHHVFQTPHDRLVWDVGHQTYAHKILTGRRERMHTLPHQRPISCFPTPMRTTSRPAGVSACTRCASKAASRAFRSAARACTTPSARRIRAPASRPRWAWRWRPNARARAATPWRSWARAR